MASTLKARLTSYLTILTILSISAAFLPITIVLHPLLLLTSPSSFRSKWFEQMWNVVGPMQANKPAQIANIDSIMSRARGIVLEIGPGTGEQSHHFKANQITRVYGAEPNVFMHPKLLEKAKAAGLQGKYVALGAGAEPDSLIPALKKAGLIPRDCLTLPDEGVFDCIVSVKVLCSVSKDQTAATLAVFQRLLKPKGEFVFFEHVVNHTDVVTRLLAGAVGIVWPFFSGGCRLDGNLDKVVNSMGGWADRRVQTTDDFQGFEVIRYVKGVCTKE